MTTFDLGDVSNTFRQFVTDLSAYSVATVVPAILSLTALIIFTRVFSPATFGRYSIAIAVAGIGSTLLTGWIDRSVLRFAPEMDSQELVEMVFSLVGVISLVVLPIAGVAYLLFGEALGAYEPFYVAALAFMLTQGLFQPLVVLYRATLNSKLVTAFKSLNAVVKIVASVFLALVLLDDIVGWLWGGVIGFVVTLGAMFATSSTLRTVPRIRREHLARMAGYGLPMIGWILGDPLLNQADRLLIEFLRGSAAVGIYASNYSLVDRGLRLALLPILQSIQPIVFNAWCGDNRDEIQRLLNRFTRYFLILATPPLVLISALSKPLSTMLLGEQFHPGFVVIPIVSVGVALWSLANLGQLGLEVQELTGLLSRGLLGAVVFNVVVDIPLIITFGYIGAAVGTVLSYAVYAGFVWVASRQHVSWVMPTRTVRNVFVAGGAMAVPPTLLYVSGEYTLIRAVVTAVFMPPIYLGVLYLSGEITPAEFDRLRSFV